MRVPPSRDNDPGSLRRRDVCFDHDPEDHSSLVARSKKLEIAQGNARQLGGLLNAPTCRGHHVVDVTLLERPNHVRASARKWEAKTKNRVDLVLTLRDGRDPSGFVGEVRGLGLMIGIELVHDQKTKEKAPDLRDHVVACAFERGLLVLGAGDNTVRLSPPLVITRDQCDFAIQTLEECLREATQHG